jgi:ABC-type sulfate transport system substrate-binding protein
MKQSIAQWLQKGEWRRPVGWLLGLALVAVVAFYGVRALLVDRHAPVHLVVYAFSTQEDALTQGIFPAFKQEWEAKTGRSLTIEGVFGASGTLAGQINLGAPADVAVFSNAEHVDWLKVGKRVHLRTEPVIVGCTPMVIAARPGNPLKLSGFSDLAQPGLKLLHADPRSSGAGEWGVLAEYGSAYFPTKDKAAGEAQLEGIWRNVRLLAPSARAAMSLFELGAGDALFTYEQDALLAKRRGVGLDSVIPPRTIVAQPAAVIVDGNVTRAERPVAEDFVSFLSSSAGQQVLGRFYMRPANCKSDALPPLVQSISVADLGGWSQAYADLVDGVWKRAIEPNLNLDAAPVQPIPGEP